MQELVETIDRLEQDLSEVLDKMMHCPDSETTTYMNQAGHLDWEIRARTEALMTILRRQYAPV